QMIRNMQAAVLAHLVLVDNPPHHPQGDFSLERDLVRAGVGNLLTFSGIGVYRATLFEPVVAGTRAALAPLLRAQMPSGGISGEHHRGQWDDIGTPQRLDALDARLR